MLNTSAFGWKTFVDIFSVLSIIMANDPLRKWLLTGDPTVIRILSVFFPPRSQET